MRINKEFGRDVQKKVNNFIKHERESNRVENPVFDDEPEAVDHSIYCSFCDTKLTEVGEQDRGMCESCQAKKEQTDWYDETEEECKELAEEFGYHMKQTGGWGKSSWYYELDNGYHQISLRISNHGVLYCKGNDISISMNPTPDDHTIADLRRLMENNK